MKEPNDKVSQSRRKFLRDAGLCSGAAAVAAGAPGLALAEARENEAGARASEGYRLTQHILDYYKSAAS
jgi:hypothetical protein